MRSKNTLHRRGERKKMIPLDHFSDAARLRAGNLPIFPFSCLSLLTFENNLLLILDFLSEQDQTPPLSGEPVPMSKAISGRTGGGRKPTFIIHLGLNPDTFPNPNLTQMYKLLYGFFFTFFFLLAAQLQAQTVFITKTGAKYHKESCRYAKSGWAATLTDAKKIGLTACLVFKPSSTETGDAKPIPLSINRTKVSQKF